MTLQPLLTGTNGVDGSAGVNGVAGPAGIPGAQGAAGQAGSNGAHGTNPIRPAGKCVPLRKTTLQPFRISGTNGAQGTRNPECLKGRIPQRDVFSSGVYSPEGRISSGVHFPEGRISLGRRVGRSRHPGAQGAAGQASRSSTDAFISHNVFIDESQKVNLPTKPATYHLLLLDGILS